MKELLFPNKALTSQFSEARIGPGDMTLASQVKVTDFVKSPDSFIKY
jgi:hypothetical protein